MLKTIDDMLNRYTMYKIVTWGLGVLLVVAGVLSFTGALSISLLGLVLSIVVLVGSCYFTNKVLSRLLHAHANTDSWLITGLILVCILPPSTTVSRVGLLAVAGIIAMASKYLLVYRGSHFLNPAAVAAFVLSVSGLLPATWWLASPVILPFTALLALVVLRKQRKFAFFTSFAIPVVLMLVFIGSGFHDLSVWSVIKTTATSWPVVFMGSIMLTEPTTLPPTKYYQLLFGALTGVIFASELHIGPVYSTPQTALLMGNLFTLIVAPPLGVMLRLKRRSQLSPNTYEIAFKRPTSLKFEAGQYLDWTLPHPHADARGARRTLSIASAPTENEVRMGIKTYEPSSTFKKALLALKPGQQIRVAHVAGNFTLPSQTDKPLIFIAGGIGITPFRSMLQYLIDIKQKRDITLVYTAATEADFVYKDILGSAKSIGVKAQYVTGRLQGDTLRQALPDLKQSLVYISGPDAMVSDTKRLLLRLGVPHGRIKTDHFTGY
jgi:ferredoxin-NADP reductase